MNADAITLQTMIAAADAPARTAAAPAPDARAVLREYAQLHDRLSDMIEDGRLGKADIPDDYRWLADTLARLAPMIDRALAAEAPAFAVVAVCHVGGRASYRIARLVDAGDGLTYARCVPSPTAMHGWPWTFTSKAQAFKAAKDHAASAGGRVLAKLYGEARGHFTMQAVEPEAA